MAKLNNNSLGRLDRASGKMPVAVPGREVPGNEVDRGWEAVDW